MLLDNRELATVILLVGFVGWMLTRANLRHGLGSVGRALASTRVLIAAASTLVCGSTIVILGRALGIWDVGLARDTAIVGLGASLPVILSTPRVAAGLVSVANVVRSTLGLAGFMSLYTVLSELPLWGELIEQAALGTAVMVFVYSRTKPGGTAAARFSAVVVTLIAALMVVRTAMVLGRIWDAIDHITFARTLAVTVWLPMALLPAVYLVALWVHLEWVVGRLSASSASPKVPRGTRFAILLGVRGRISVVRALVNNPPEDFADWEGFRDAVHGMRVRRRAIRRTRVGRRRPAPPRPSTTSHAEVDGYGFRIDRREFAATKHALLWLYTTQQAWHRQSLRHYRDDLPTMLPDGEPFRLPQDHGIVLRLSADRQSWCAWRRTISGWFFGIGGSNDVYLRWQYSGPVPPREFPHTINPEWLEAGGSEMWPDWTVVDA